MSKHLHAFSFFMLCALPTFATVPTDASVTDASSSEVVATAEQEVDQNNPWVLAMQAATKGPAEIVLANQATLRLPAGYLYVPKKEAAVLMDAWGNSTGDEFHGLVFSDQEDNWFTTIDYIASGYIKDDDAKDWDAEELLDSIKEGTEEQNKMRAQRGINEMEIVGWVQQPTYQANIHHLVYSISSKDKGAAADAEQGINYNTYVLGREGYFNLNLVTGLSAIGEDKRHAETLLSALTFNDGKRYDQFVEGTDHVAEYGLAALVAGAAAKKIGLLATIGLFFAKAWKLILLAGIGVVAGIRKFFGKKDV